MAIGEKEVFDWTALNLQNQNLQPGLVVVFDNQGGSPNSNGGALAACLPTGSGDVFLGVVTDKIRLSIIDGAVEAGQAVSFRDMGYAWCFAGPTASGVIAVGDRVNFDGTAGQIKSVSAGDLLTSFGTAMTPTSAQGQAVLVRLGAI